jgi:ABC-type glycerol-3-phosphate transport system substrate-binding protein|nr:hypothetical protein [Kofleriaceae bacterium]
MSKLGLLSSIVALVASLGIATFSASTADADGGACVRKEFKTDLVKEACTGTKDKPGNQDAAKDAMKKFNKAHNIKSCNDCHTKLSPNYELKDDGLKRFNDLGGK